MEQLNLTTIERNSWRNVQKDGLLDALFGVIFLAAAVVAVLDRIPVPDVIRIGSLVAIQFSGVAAMIWMRKRYVAPRLGRVKYALRRVRRTRTLRILLAMCVILTILLVVLTALADRLGFGSLSNLGDLRVWLLITAVIFIPIGAIAYFLEYPRILLYAAALSAVEFLHIVLDLPERVPYGGAYAYGAASLTAFAIGITIYVRFVRRVPRARPEDTENTRVN